MGARRTRTGRLVLALAAALSQLPARAAAAQALFDDHKLGPPAGCLQDALGLGLSLPFGPPATLAGVDDFLRGGGKAEGEGLRWAERALHLKPRAGVDDWSRLDAAWSRYAAALTAQELTRRRSCTGGYLAERSFVDLLYVVLAPVWMFSAFSPDANDKAHPSRIFVPVVGAVGLATDPLFLVVSPFAALRVAGRDQAVASARDSFSSLVVGLESPPK